LAVGNLKLFRSRFCLCFDADSKKATGMVGIPGSGSGGQAAQDPIGALQNLARQGIFRSIADFCC